MVGDFHRWMLSTLRTTAWLALLSFVSTAIVGSLLVVAQRSIQGESGALVIPGFPVSLQTDWLGSGLPVLIIALGAWMALSSLSHLAQAAVLRWHLRRHSSSGSIESEDTDPDDDLEPSPSGPGGFMVERMMFESYLTVVTSTTRALALSLVLVFLQPRQTALGLSVCWLLLVTMGVYRFRLGARASMEFVATNRAVRAGQRSPEDLIDVIYARDRHVTRLPIGQAFTATSAALLLVLLPLWVYTKPLPIAGLILFVIWLPSLMAALTQASPLGWRAAASFSRSRQPSAPAGPEEETVAKGEDEDHFQVGPRVTVTTLPITKWSGRTPLWVRIPGANRTAVLVVDAAGQVGSWPAPVVVGNIAKLEWSVLVIPRRVADGRVLLPGEESGRRLQGYLAKGPTLVLCGETLSKAAMSLAKEIDQTRVVIVGPCVTSESNNMMISLEDKDFQNLIETGTLAATLESWAPVNPDLPSPSAHGTQT